MGGCTLTAASSLGHLQHTSQALKYEEQRKAGISASCRAESVTAGSCHVFSETFVKCSEHDVEQKDSATHVTRAKKPNSFLLVCSMEPQSPVLFLHLEQYLH